MANEKYPYQKEWEDYRKKAKKCWIAWLICMPVIWLTIIFSDNVIKAFFSGNRITLFVPIFLLVVAVLCWFNFKVITWDCPRCNNSARNKMLFAQMVVTDCRSCGLTKYEGSTFRDTPNGEVRAV